jgi:hypothetical protein
MSLVRPWRELWDKIVLAALSRPTRPRACRSAGRIGGDNPLTWKQFRNPMPGASDYRGFLPGPHQVPGECLYVVVQPRGWLGWARR